MRVDDGKGHVFHYDIFAPTGGEAKQGIGLNDVCVIESITDTNRPINLPDFYVKIATYVPDRRQWLSPKIKGQINPLPPELTADSEPNMDQWGPDDYWSPGTYILWHQLNIQKYGKQVADLKIMDAFSNIGWFGAENDYCYSAEFRNYFAANGIDNIWCDVDAVLENATNTAANVSDAANKFTKVLSIAAPFLAIGAGIFAVDKFVYPLFKRT